MIQRAARSFVLLSVILLAVSTSAPLAAGEHRLGFGANYFRTIDDLEDEGFDNIEIDNNGLSFLGSYQYRPQGMFAFEFDLEYFGDGFGGATREAWSPQFYIVLGRNWFAAVGAGVTYSDEFPDEISDPFYAAKAGFNLGLLPQLSLEIAANYRFDAWSELEEADTDTIFLGALLRFSL